MKVGTADEAAMRRAVAAAESATTALPAIINGLDVMSLGERKWSEMRKAGNWVALHDRDAYVNLDHPEVKRALAEAEKPAA